MSKKTKLPAKNEDDMDQILNNPVALSEYVEKLTAIARIQHRCYPSPQPFSSKLIHKRSVILPQENSITSDENESNSLPTIEIFYSKA